MVHRPCVVSYIVLWTTLPLVKHGVRPSDRIPPWYPFREIYVLAPILGNLCTGTHVLVPVYLPFFFIAPKPLHDSFVTIAEISLFGNARVLSLVCKSNHASYLA